MIFSCDTSATPFFLALATKKEVFYFRAKENQKAGAHLLKEIDIFLKTHQIKLKEIDIFGLCEGPGAFQSLRVGFCVLEAFSFFHKKPLWGADNLYLQALYGKELVGKKSFLSLVPAGRGRFYVRSFLGATPKSQISLLDEQEIATLALRLDRPYIICKPSFISETSPLYQTKLYGDKDKIIFVKNILDPLHKLILNKKANQNPKPFYHENPYARPKTFDPTK